VDLNIAALNSHDGNSAFRLLVTPVRVVCANTQHAALRNHLSSWSIRHTRNAKAAVQAARDTLGLTFAYVEAFEAEAERMINTSVTDAAFFELVRTCSAHPTPDAPARTRNAARRRQASLAHLWHDAATQSGIGAPRGRPTRASWSTSTTTPRSATSATPPRPARCACSPPTNPPGSRPGRGPHSPRPEHHPEETAMSTHPTDRDLDLWLIDKDAEGVLKPGPGVVYDRAGLGIVFMDDRGRDFTFIDTGVALEVFAGQAPASPPRWRATSPPPSSGSRTTPTA
jgi:hypothetical protein